MGETEKAPEKKSEKIEVKKEEIKKAPQKTPPVKEEKTDKADFSKKFPLKANQAKPVLKAGKQEPQPYDILDVFGGDMTALAIDEDVYCAWGRKFFVLDSTLAFKKQFFVKSQITRFFVASKNKQKYLYVFYTEGFSIFSISKDGLSPVGDYDIQAQVYGPYEGVSGGLYVFILLPDEVQVVEVTDPKKTDFLASIPKNSVQSVFATGDYFYLVTQNNIDIYNWNTFSLTSSLSFEKNTDILNVWKDEKKTFLILGFKNDQGYYTELNLAPLSSDGLITEKGETWVLQEKAKKTHFDPEKGFLYLVGDNTFYIFNLKKNLLWEGPMLNFGGVLALSSKKNLVIYSAGDGLHLMSYEVLETNQTGETASTVPALKWNEENFIALPTAPGRIFLFGKSALIADRGGLYLASSWMTQPLDFKMIEGFSDIEIDGISVTKMGLLFFDKKSGKFVLLNKTLKNPILMTLAPQPVTGFTIKETENGFYLYLAVGNESTGYSFSVYFVSAPDKAQKIGELALPYAGGVVVSRDGTKAFVACGSDGICPVDLKEIKNSKISLLQKITFGPKGAFVGDLVFSPRSNIGFVYIDKSSESAEAIMYVAKFSDQKVEGARLSVSGLTQEHFRGMTFSKGGEIVIMPGKDGLSFFDINFPDKPKLLNIWSFNNPVQADVTNKAQIVCSVIKGREVVCVKEGKGKTK